VHAAIALQEPARLLPHLFYFIVDIRRGGINAATCFIASFILIYCACNRSFRGIRGDGPRKIKVDGIEVLISPKQLNVITTDGVTLLSISQF